MRSQLVLSVESLATVLALVGENPRVLAPVSRQGVGPVEDDVALGALVGLVLPPVVLQTHLRAEPQVTKLTLKGCDTVLDTAVGVSRARERWWVERPRGENRVDSVCGHGRLLS